MSLSKWLLVFLGFGGLKVLAFFSIVNLKASLFGFNILDISILVLLVAFIIDLRTEE